MLSKLWKKLRDPEYRKAFVASQINIGIPFQIRALMKNREPKWTQEDLARKAGMLQPRISAMLRPGKTRPNIETLRRIAEAFDCGLVVRFVPFSELVLWSEKFDPDSFNVASFAEDSGFIDQGNLALESIVPKYASPATEQPVLIFRSPQYEKQIETTAGLPRREHPRPTMVPTMPRIRKDNTFVGLR
jgi:transcriptional regulator with XRE-family HTH domain